MYKKKKKSKLTEKESLKKYVEKQERIQLWDIRV